MGLKRLRITLRNLDAAREPMPEQITLERAPETEAAVRFLEELFEAVPLHQVAFKLWDGMLWPDEKPRAASLVLKHPGALREMFHTGTEKGLAEAFLRDDFDIEGDIEAAFEIADAWGGEATAG